MCVWRKFSARCGAAKRAFWGAMERGKIQWHGNKIQHNEFIKASTANGAHSTTNSTKYGEFGNTNNAKRYFVGETIHDTASTANSAWQVWQNGVCRQNKADDTANSARRKWSSFCRQSRQSENGTVFGRGTSLSRCSHFLAH